MGEVSSIGADPAGRPAGRYRVSGCCTMQVRPRFTCFVTLPLLLLCCCCCCCLLLLLVEQLLVELLLHNILQQPGSQASKPSQQNKGQGSWINWQPTCLWCHRALQVLPLQPTTCESMHAPQLKISHDHKLQQTAQPCPAPSGTCTSRGTHPLLLGEVEGVNAARRK